jgi:hypothetical protein
LTPPAFRSLTLSSRCIFALARSSVEVSLALPARWTYVPSGDFWNWASATFDEFDKGFERASPRESLARGSWRQVFKFFRQK